MSADVSSPSSLIDLSAQELSAAYRDKRLSPVEVTHAVIAHIERWEPQLQATWLFRPEAALEQARASEARWQRGEALGPLDGVPATIKENIATRGDPMPAGTAAVDLKPAVAVSPPAVAPAGLAVAPPEP
jgi:aspartyl-tRNA(Asn)/glutamyl-tRNA(Gln) amidotransferase subunit A